MSEFKLGDLVKRIADPEHDYRYMKSGEIYTVTGLPADDCESINVNGFTDCWDVDYFELYVPQQVIVETQPTELDECYAKIDTLESALEDAVKEILDLQQKNNALLSASLTLTDIVTNESEFKPISEYTLEDWELAKKHKWLFADNRGDESLLVESVQKEEIYFDGYSYPFTIDGVHTDDPEEYQIIKRIK